MIVKLQFPLSDPRAPLLAYDQRRNYQAQIPQTPELCKLFGNKLKIYVDATEEENGRLNIKRVVSDRSW